MTHLVVVFSKTQCIKLGYKRVQLIGSECFDFICKFRRLRNVGLAFLL